MGLGVEAIVREGAVVRTRGLLFAVLTGAVLLGALALILWRGGPGVFDQTSDAALARRAQLYWDLEVTGDTKGAWELMVSAFRRRVTPAQFARQGGRVIRTGARVKSVERDEKGALVEVELRWRFAHPNFAEIEHEQTIRDRWVLEDGAWYRWPPGL